MTEWQKIDTECGTFWTSSERQRTDLFQVVSEQSEYSPHRYSDGMCGVQQGNVVIDVGSHLGVFTQCALDRGASKVVAIEPNRESADSFRRTFELELLSEKVVLVQCAAWSSSGLGLRMSGEGVCYHVDEDFESVKLDPTSVSIDTLVKALQIERVDFIKLDVEGAERHALRGARETILRDKPSIACCIYHRQDDPAAVLDAVRSVRDDYTVTAGRVPPWLTTPELYFFWR